MSECENQNRVETGLPCGRHACWVVRVGSRETRSCGGCLPYVAEAMYAAADRPDVRVTLEPLSAW